MARDRSGLAAVYPSRRACKLPDMSADSFQPLRIAIATASDSRALAEDRSGQYLVQAAQDAGHEVLHHEVVPDSVYRIRALLSGWIADEEVEVIITNGGTGITGRDGTPEAVRPLFDKEIEGFGELFRQLSYDDIGASAIQSRCVAGVANGTLIFCLPGSAGACRLGWEQILLPQLDRRTRPCNFAQLLPRLLEK